MYTLNKFNPLTYMFVNSPMSCCCYIDGLASKLWDVELSRKSLRATSSIFEPCWSMFIFHIYCGWKKSCTTKRMVESWMMFTIYQYLSTGSDFATIHIYHRGFNHLNKLDQPSQLMAVQLRSQLSSSEFCPRMYEEIMAAYPEAKFLLTISEPETWQNRNKLRSRELGDFIIGGNLM